MKPYIRFSLGLLLTASGANGTLLAQTNPAPAQLGAVAQTSTQINLTWKDNSPNETGFEIESSRDNRTFTKIGDAGANALSYQHTGLSPGTRYYYRVRAALPRSTFTGYSNTADATTPTPPPVTNDLKTSVKSATSIELTWAVTGKEPQYAVERRAGQSGRFERIGGGSGSYTDNNLTPGTEYCYRVQYAEGTEVAPYSNIACATTQQSAPSAPARLTANAVSSSQINLQWADVSNNETGFEVERASSPTASFTKIADLGAGTTTYSDQNLTASTPYCYRVRAVNGAGPSGYADVQCATTQAPPLGTPQNLAAQATSTTQINLTWNGVTGAAGYQLERSPNGTDGWTNIANPAASATSYSDNNLAPNTRYYYRIRAFTAGTAVVPGPYGNVANAQTPAAPPAAPIRLSASAASFRQINLQWGDQSGNESGFEIERSPNGTDGWTKIADVGANATTYSDPSLSPRTRYYYRVRAVNAAGPSPHSNVADATTPDGPPAAPTQLTATPASNSQINLTWTDGADNETAFELERSADGTNWTKIADIPANATTFQNSGLTPDRRYYYRIRAVNAVGQSAYSNTAEATTPDVPPAPPARLTATPASPTQINLTWGDLSANESGFEVERSNTATGAFVKLADLPANATTYEDKNLTDNTAYCYRVRAKNAAGVSGYTEVACATTPLAPPAAPKDLTAQLFDYDQVRLTWPGVSANAVTVVVERSTDPNAGFTEIKQQPAAQAGYVDVGLQEFTTYFYRIRAVNTAGNSGYSNVASARVEEVVVGVEDELETHTTLFVSQRTLHLVTNWYAPAATSVQLLTPTGQVVLTNSRKVNPADRWSYDLDQVPTGLYIIHINANGRRLAKRIILP